MLKIKLTAGSKYIRMEEEQAIEVLQRLLLAEDGYIIPGNFIGGQAYIRRIDAALLLPDAIFLLDFKNWDGERIEVEGINGKVRRLVHGVWEEENNTLPNYEYAARALANRLKREQWLPAHPHIYSVMVFTSIGLHSSPQVSFAGGDPNRPQLKDGVGACRIEQVPQLIAAFRAATDTREELNRGQLSILASVLLNDIAKTPAKSEQRIEVHSDHIEGSMAEASDDATLRFRIMEEPLTASNLNLIISSLIELHTKCWLIGNLRLADLIDYAQTHNNAYVEEAHLVIAKLTHNSPTEINLKVDASPTGIAKALEIGIDAVGQAGIRYKEANLKTQAQEAEIKLKELEAQSTLADQEQIRQIAAREAALAEQEKLLEIEQKRLALQRARFELEVERFDFALETAGKMIEQLYPDADAQTKSMLSRSLLPGLLHLSNGQGLELVLPELSYQQVAQIVQADKEE